MRDQGKIRYIISDDPDFDVVKLKSVHGSPYIKIYDTMTGKCVDLKRQEYMELFSGSKEELTQILEGIIYKNSQFSKAEIVEMLHATVKSALLLFYRDLKLVKFRGYINGELPQGDVAVGDVYILNNSVYVCEKADKTGAKWRHLCTDEDLLLFYTKEEFDEKYFQHIELISALVSGDLYEYSEDFKNRFIKKEDAAELMALNQEYAERLNDLHTWRDEQQIRVDEYIAAVNELSAYVQDVSLNQNLTLSTWMIEQSGIIEAKLNELFEMQRDLEQKVDSTEEIVHRVSTEVAILSGALNAIRNGEQSVLGERYEA